MAPVGDGFELVVTRDNKTLGRAPVPADGNATTVGGLAVRREEGSLRAERGDTRVMIAERA